MPVIITSSTDTPEDVAAATGAEIEKEETTTEETVDQKVEGEDTTEGEETTDETKTEGEDKDGEEGEKAKVEAKTGDEDEDEEGEGEGEEKPKKITGYKKKYLKAQEENRLLLDLLKKQERSSKEDDEPEEEPVVEAKPDPKTQTFSGKPKPKIADFKDAEDPYAALAEAMGDWALEEATAKLKAERTADTQNDQRIAAKSDFNDRLAEVRKEGGVYADYDEVLESAATMDLPVTPLMQGLIMNAKVTVDGKVVPINVDVMHFLASNPDRCREIAQMEPVEQAAEMGVVRREAWAETQRRVKELESKSSSRSSKTNSKTTDGKQSQGKTDDGEPVVVKPKTKNPPPPVTPVGKRTVKTSTDLADIASAGDFKAYEAQRRNQGFRYR